MIDLSARLAMALLPITAAAGIVGAVQVAIVTFDGFNEIDSFLALNILNRVALDAYIVAPAALVSSMNGVQVSGTRPLELANEADAVIVGSGTRTLQVCQDEAIVSRLALDPTHQLIASQCSGALLLDQLGLLSARQACTDAVTRPTLEARGVSVIERPFVCHGNVATAGGCLSAHYLAAWIVSRLLDAETAERALQYVVPVGEAAAYIERAMTAIGQH